MTENSDLFMIVGAILFIIVAAFLLGIRDKRREESNLLSKLKNNFGKAPDRVYKSEDLEHVTGFYKNHSDGFCIDDTTWADLSMDSIFKRVNYCLSAAGEEYLYYMLRSPRQKDDFDSFERQVSFFEENDEERRRIQLIYYNVGRNSKYSIYDYLDYLKNVRNTGNGMNYLMLILMLLSIGVCFFDFLIGFIFLIVLMLIQIFSYFRVKGEIDPYLVTYGYIMRVIKSIDRFYDIKDEVFKRDIDRLREISGDFSAFKTGANLLLSPMRMNSGGNPADLIMDYVRMVTHVDIIKFNQMYRLLMERKDKLDEVLEITGRIEAEISVACFRASFSGKYVVPLFGHEGYDAKELIHPLIEGAVSNDISTGRGVLLTGSNASGKSTFLKTCAINAILAQSLHTVLGSFYRAPFYRIYSSMALKDDIFEGDSYYIVEIKSIKRILDAAAESGSKVLCFVDEVLRGTNTIERIAASTQILKKLANEDVQCFAATHDLELTSLLDDLYDIYHFEGAVSDNDVKFDYRLKDGPATTRNAIKLLSVLGYDETLVGDAQKMADVFLNEGQWKKSN